MIPNYAGECVFLGETEAPATPANICHTPDHFMGRKVHENLFTLPLSIGWGSDQGASRKGSLRACALVDVRRKNEVQ